MQIVVYRLGGEGAKPFAGCGCNRFHISMLPFALDRSEYGKPGPRHPKAGPAKAFVECEFVRRHTPHYILLSGMIQ
jgi:hypothetical protein